MRISILIASYNGKKYIIPLLNSIKNLATGNHEIETILRDDNSSDGTAEAVAEHYPWVTLIKGKETVGFGMSNNIVFQHATGDIICCVNQDTILDSRFIVEGVSLLEGRDDIAGINTNMIMPWALSLEEFKKTERENMPSYEFQFTPYGFAKYLRVDPVVRETNYLTGGGFFLRRSALGSGEHLFDPDISMYCEDTELVLRLMKYKQKLLYAPKAILYHDQTGKKGGSYKEFKKLISVTWNRFNVLAQHSHPLIFLKNYPLYLWGIVKKMDSLGLSFSKTVLAYLAGACLTVPFFFTLPYWLWHAFTNYKKLESA